MFVLSQKKGLQKIFLLKSSIYLIDIFEDNQNIVRDRFKTDSVNVIKNRLLLAKETQGNFKIC